MILRLDNRGSQPMLLRGLLCSEIQISQGAAYTTRDVSRVGFFFSFDTTYKTTNFRTPVCHRA
jgi:hypothetical protein